MSRWLRARTRADRVIAAALLVVVAPVIGVLALAIRLADRGPGLIRVPRVGRGGTEFGMWKLRSMRATSSDGTASGAALTARDDDRITPLGRRLRRFRLDELPQLLNVLRGEMSLIGPRPEAPAYVDRTDDQWRTILAAPPGIAGATQVLVDRWEAKVLDAATSDAVYRETILPVKVALDAWYVGAATPRLDALVVRSLVASLTGRHPTHLREVATAAVAEARGLADA
jgi:lipopolysaccharide/colanic/teichoic acid biosynthesis glycosyltransferase